jgi:ankyrin repeat protein
VPNRYRWVFCQLETLRHCLPSSVRRTLDELPESLDETYERVLREIKKPNRDHARRLLQCLVVAIRPLRVEELAEVLAVDFDSVDGTPKLNTSWRWEDEEQALLSSCSSLIAIVGTGYERVVQFSHFSVKEFLTSPRLSTSSGDVSRYHVALEPAHIVLAQACLGVLLQLDGRSVDSDIENSYPLAVYAAEHWVPHAQFENASSHLRKAMESLFDPDKPQFAAWLQLYDIDNRLTISPFLEFTMGSNRGGSTPLYYAARCGFQDLAKCLLDRHPYYVNANGGQYVAPIVVALAAGHFQLAQLLYERGANVDVQGHSKRTPLYGASGDGSLEITQWLLNRGADPNTPGETYRLAPLHLAANCGHIEVARILLRYNADRNPQNTTGLTPLHLASRAGHPEVVRLLLEHGVDANTQDSAGKTSLHKASANGYHDVARLLLEHGVDVDALDKHLSTPLHLASHNGNSETVRMLIEHGADVDAKNDEGRTALQLALAKGLREITKLLSDHGSKSEVT